jgi:hypothetical protein
MTPTRSKSSGTPSLYQAEIMQLSLYCNEVRRRPEKHYSTFQLQSLRSATVAVLLERPVMEIATALYHNTSIKELNKVR